MNNDDERDYAEEAANARDLRECDNPWHYEPAAESGTPPDSPPACPDCASTLRECGSPWHYEPATPDGTHPGPPECPDCGDLADPFDKPAAAPCTCYGCGTGRPYDCDRVAAAADAELYARYNPTDDDDSNSGPGWPMTTKDNT